jgi:hypothetical protein
LRRFPEKPFYSLDRKIPLRAPFVSAMYKINRFGIVFRLEPDDEFRPAGWGADNFGANGFPTALVNCPFGPDLHFESMLWTGNDDPHHARRTARHPGQIGHADAISGNVEDSALIKSAAI